MEDPVAEISTAIDVCAGSPTADMQVSGFHYYFTEDASFLHPLCYIPSRPGSRNRIIGIFLFYRGLIPHTHFDIQAIAFDEKKGKLFVDLLQTPQVRGLRLIYSPTVPMHIHFQLRKVDDRWFIAGQEDVVQPMSLLLAFPPLRPITYLFYFICQVMGLLNALIFVAFGIWRPTKHLKRLLRLP